MPHGMKPRNLKLPTNERIEIYRSLASNRGYTPVQADVLARMLAAVDAGQPPATALASFTTQDRALYTQFMSI